jgi:hypothetical protein
MNPSPEARGTTEPVAAGRREFPDMGEAAPALCRAAELYSRAILEQAPRVLSLMDREILSPTAGCCDRTYWAWKFVDFPGARFQEAVCVMSFLYSTELPESPYFHNPRLLRWIALGLEYWSSIQYPDGSFDEAYPYERSLAATAFTSFYVSEALHFLNEDLEASTRSRVIRSLRRAGEWLIRNDETHGFLSNHLAAAAAALQHIYCLTRAERFRERSQYFLEKILAHQSNEGWYEEYGGADPGYQTHGSFYLARICQISSNDRLTESLCRSMDFLALFIHPDRSIGGEYASRNTQTYYPAAFEMLASRGSSASFISERMRAAVETGSAAGLRSVDAYNYFPFLNNLVFAYLACAAPDRSAAEPIEPSPEEGLLWFSGAGLARIRRERYDAYVGTAKGGVLKVFDRIDGAHAYTDCGYLGKLQNGRFFSSQNQQPDRHTEVSVNGVTVDGAFYEVSKPIMKPARFIGFRLFSLTAGRSPGLARWLKNYLVRALIYKRNSLDIRFRRSIEFHDDTIVIRDEIAGPGGAQVKSVQRGEIFTTIHMGSSRYFIANELERTASIEPPADPEIVPSQIAAGVTLTRTVRFAAGLS